MKDLDEWFQEIVRALRRQEIVGFSGLGVVFYGDRKMLPVHSLVSRDALPQLPVAGTDACVRLLSEISRKSSPCHDGFTLISTDARSITDVSQFLAPPIPSPPLDTDHEGGARHLAARLASLVVGIDATAVCSSNFDATFFVQGVGKAIRL
jgi:hypothetical protein